MIDLVPQVMAPRAFPPRLSGIKPRGSLVRWRTYGKALAPGEKVRFSDGTVYQQQAAGNLVRISPRKPYKNRAEQKQYLKWRRRQRAIEADAAAQYGTYDEVAR